jgi:hypothetical protein
MLNNFFTRIYNGASNLVSGMTSAVGKFKEFGSAVGKHINNITQSLTPETIGKAVFSGLTGTMVKISKATYLTTEKPNIIDGYNLDKQLSNVNTLVYYNDQNVIIGFRGTRTIDDLITDVSVVRGTDDNIRFQQAIEMYNRVKNKYPNKTIMTTGQSLGGSLALYLNSLYGIRAEVFNPGVGLGFLKSNPNRANAFIYVIKGDPISALTGLSNLGTLKVYEPLDPESNMRQRHSLSNFTTTS